MSMIDELDRELVAASQGGLPVSRQPFAAMASATGLSEADVVARLAALSARGVVRRVAAAPNHFALGMVANGMTVWDVDDTQVSRLGQAIGAMPYVTHCYLRPRALPSWPYNLFAMVHGATRDEVEAKRSEIAARLGADCRTSDILYSARILKKTGLRLARSRG